MVGIAFLTHAVLVVTANLALIGISGHFYYDQRYSKPPCRNGDGRLVGTVDQVYPIGSTSLSYRISIYLICQKNNIRTKNQSLYKDAS